MHDLQALPIGLGNDPKENTHTDRVIASLIDEQTSSYIPVPSNDPQQAKKLLSAFDATSPCDSSIALIISTSGSTGTPKGAQLTFDALHASTQASAGALSGTGAWLLAIPGYHIAGFNVIYRSLHAGYAPYRMDLSAGFSVEAFIVAEKKFTSPTKRYISLVPTQLHKIMQNPRAISALQNFDAVLIGGASTNRFLQESLTQAEISTFYSYGMSETCGGCVYNGKPLAGVQIQLDHNSEMALSSFKKQNSGGQIMLSGKMVAQGYRNIPNHPSFSQPGWFKTDDIGIIENKTLHVLGRGDNVANISGIKINPQLIDDLIQSHVRNAECSVLTLEYPATGQVLVAVFSAPNGTFNKDHIDRIAHAIELEHGRYAIPRFWVEIEELPLIGPGKIDYNSLTSTAQELIAAGKYQLTHIR